MSATLTLYKQIPEVRKQEYLDTGWEIESVNERRVVVKYVKETNGSYNRSEPIEHSVPYLIQRGKIVRPLGEQKGVSISRAVDMDYMGSAEFEFGALPLSLRMIQAQFPMYKMHRIENFKVVEDGKDRFLRVFANFDTEDQLADYVKWLTQLETGGLRLKERSNFALSDRGPAFPKREKNDYSFTDFWWDINNNVFFSFDKNFMNRLPEIMKNTFEVMG